MLVNHKLREKFEAVYQRALRDKVLMDSLTPAETPSLHELLTRDPPCIKLASGEEQCVDPKELRELAERVPWYLHRLLKLPLIFVYKRDQWGAAFKLRGDKWCARLVNFLLRGDFTGERYVLTVDEFEKLLARFKSLVFIVIEYEAVLKVTSYDLEES